MKLIVTDLTRPIWLTLTFIFGLFYNSALCNVGYKVADQYVTYTSGFILDDGITNSKTQSSQNTFLFATKKTIKSNAKRFIAALDSKSNLLASRNGLQFNHKNASRVFNMNNNKRTWLLAIFGLLTAALLTFLYSTIFHKYMPVISRTKQKPIYTLTNHFETKQENGSSREKIERYSKPIQQPLSEKQLEEIMNAIRKRLEVHRDFINPNFNMNMLSQVLNTNRSYLSRAISNNTGKRFEVFVNEYRVREVKQLLSETRNHMFTIDHLASQVGFSSRSVFYRAFKDETGMTPSAFIKSLVNKKSPP